MHIASLLKGGTITVPVLSVRGFTGLGSIDVL